MTTRGRRFWICYTAIFLSFLVVFFGIRSYRENSGGTITFGRAFAIGLLITLISSVFYVASWEVIYFKFMPDFVDKFSSAAIATMRAKGASDAAIAAKRSEMAKMKAMHDNPLTNAAVTFLEPFPVGLVVTLVSAGILRRRARSAPPNTATTVVAWPRALALGRMHRQFESKRESKEVELTPEDNAASNIEQPCDKHGRLTLRCSLPSRRTPGRLARQPRGDALCKLPSFRYSGAWRHQHVSIDSLLAEALSHETRHCICFLRGG